MKSHAQKPIRMVFFYAEVVGYVTRMLKALLKARPTAEIDVVFQDKKHINSSRFVMPEINSIRFHARSKLNDKELLMLLFDKKPHIIFVSGWMDKGYLRTIRRYRAKNQETQVVCGTDGQWRRTLKQYLGLVYFFLFYRRLFDYMWVAGKPQYHYAQRFGYKSHQLLTNLYSADTQIFDKKTKVAKRFVFVGRFVLAKALDKLLEAYLLLPGDVQRQWPLVLIGDGPMRKKVEAKKSPNIIIKPFMQPNDLIKELGKGGVSCIASKREQWGVVIHEMALLGYPLVLSSECGAATEFLISNYNGFLFLTGDVLSLRDALLKVASLEDNELAKFSERSHRLGQRITPEQSVYSLLSIEWLSKLHGKRKGRIFK